MRIAKIEITNFRCIHDVSFPIDKYTALIGANGAGKSSCLYALAWFFNEYHAAAELHHFDHRDEPVEVCLTFDEIGPIHSKLLGPFGRRESTTLKKVLAADDSSPHYLGTAWRGPGFAQIAEMTRTSDYRPAYKELQASVEGLPKLPENVLIADIRAELSRWEEDPRNAEMLVRVEDCSADYLFGDNGQFWQAARFVLVKGSADLSQQIGAGTRDSTFASLTGSLHADATARARIGWEDRNQAALHELKEQTASAISEALNVHTHHVNGALSSYIPGATVDFDVSEPEVSVRNDSNIGTQIRFRDGSPKDVAQEGHGTQRAIMMAMVQSLAEVTEDGEPEGPLKVIAMEEPEIHQHPIRARSFARNISDLAEKKSSQIIVATHSSYFVRPDQVGSLRRFSNTSGKATVKCTSVDDIAQKMSLRRSKLLTALEKEIPKSFSEGFFSDCVLLIEGDSDAAIIGPAARHLGADLEANGISIWSLGSKERLRMHYSILTSLGTPVYVVIDGDYNASDSPEKQENHRTHTERALQVVTPIDEDGKRIEYQFGDATVVGSNMAVFEDDLENVLQQWPSCWCNIKSGSKDAYKYRVAAANANVEDMPYELKLIIEALLKYSQMHP